MSKYVYHINDIIYSIVDTTTPNPPVGDKTKLTDENIPTIQIDFYICEVLGDHHDRKLLYINGKEESGFEYVVDDVHMDHIPYKLRLDYLISDGDRCVNYANTEVTSSEESENTSDETSQGMMVVCPSKSGKTETEYFSYWDLYQNDNLNSSSTHFFIEKPESTRYFSAIEAEKFGLLYPGNWSYTTSLKNFYTYKSDGTVTKVDEKISTTGKTLMLIDLEISNFITKLENIVGKDYVEKDLVSVEDNEFNKYTLTVGYQVKTDRKSDDEPTEGETSNNEASNNGSTDSTVGVGDEDANIIEG